MKSNREMLGIKFKMKKWEILLSRNSEYIQKMIKQEKSLRLRNWMTKALFQRKIIYNISLIINIRRKSPKKKKDKEEEGEEEEEEEIKNMVVAMNKNKNSLKKKNNL